MVGSSPQVRGTSARVGLITPGRGIIPAGAGHLSELAGDRHRVRDHPRRCGALWSADAFSQDARGSSPQVRGTLVFARISVISVGIIPAGAGHLLDELGYRSKISAPIAIL